MALWFKVNNINTHNIIHYLQIIIIYIASINLQIKILITTLIKYVYLPIADSTIRCNYGIKIKATLSVYSEITFTMIS